MKKRIYTLYIYVNTLFGGDEENRTPVRNRSHISPYSLVNPVFSSRAGSVDESTLD